MLVEPFFGADAAEVAARLRVLTPGGAAERGVVTRTEVVRSNEPARALLATEKPNVIFLAPEFDEKATTELVEVASGGERMPFLLDPGWAFFWTVFGSSP